jgi:hypothetical protein
VSVLTEEQEWDVKITELVPKVSQACMGYQRAQAVGACVEVACQLCLSAGMSKADFLIKVTEHWEEIIERSEPKEEEARGN